MMLESTHDLWKCICLASWWFSTTDGWILWLSFVDVLKFRFHVDFDQRTIRALLFRFTHQPALDCDKLQPRKKVNAGHKHASTSDIQSYLSISIHLGLNSSSNCVWLWSVLHLSDQLSRILVWYLKQLLVANAGIAIDPRWSHKMSKLTSRLQNWDALSHRVRLGFLEEIES